jgi:hypothetical protein
MTRLYLDDANITDVLLRNGVSAGKTLPDHDLFRAVHRRQRFCLFTDHSRWLAFGSGDFRPNFDGIRDNQAAPRRPSVNFT